MYLKNVKYNKKIEKGETRVKFENDYQISLNIYSNEDGSLVKKNIVDIDDLLVESSTMFDEFTSWIRKCCREFNITNQQINIEENIFYYIIQNIIN